MLLSLPLSVVVMRSSAVRLPRIQFGGAMVAGVLLHGLVTLVALG